MKTAKPLENALIVRHAVKKSVQCFNGAAGVFVDAPDGWFGWLRLDEIVVDK